MNVRLILSSIESFTAHCLKCIREGKKPTWTEEEEEELRKLYLEHRDSEGLLALSFLFAQFL